MNKQVEKKACGTRCSRQAASKKETVKVTKVKKDDE